MAIKLHPSFAVHAGVWLRTEIVEPHGLTVSAAAEKLGVSRQAMSSLLNGRAGISAEMAIRFEKAFGLRADSCGCRRRMTSPWRAAMKRTSRSKRSPPDPSLHQTYWGGPTGSGGQGSHLPDPSVQTGVSDTG